MKDLQGKLALAPTHTGGNSDVGTYQPNSLHLLQIEILSITVYVGKLKARKERSYTTQCRDEAAADCHCREPPEDSN